MSNSVVFENLKPRPVLNFQFSTLMLMKCTKREWAEQFQNGKIYLSTPQQWIDEEKKGNVGQGDLLEGAFCSVLEDDEYSELARRLEGESNIECFTKNGYLFFRRRSVLHLRCLCMYGLHNDAFHKEILTDGRAKYTATIPKEYFSDFCKVDDRVAYKRIKMEDQPVVLLIGNPNEFFKRIKQFLMMLDVKEEEIIISPVDYIDRYAAMKHWIIRVMILINLGQRSYNKRTTFRKYTDSVPITSGQEHCPRGTS